MANFVSLNRYIPDPDIDAISQVTIAGGTPGGPASAEIGLWGYYDSASQSELVVKIITGPGRVQKGQKRGSAVMSYALYNITEATIVQAFLGDRPWTQPLPVVRDPSASGLKGNARLLQSSDTAVQAANVYVCGMPGFKVRTVPVPIDGHTSSPNYRGLAIHVTAGEGNAEQIVRSTWGSSGVSAHFVIERDGAIVQCVAFSLRAEAQGGPGSVGDPNADWLSVEIVTAMNNAGTDGFFTGSQITSANRLFLDLAAKFRFPVQLASPLINDDGDYQRLSRGIVAQFGLTGAKTHQEAQASQGLSCHRWLNSGHACPGLIGLRAMPVIAGLGMLGVA